jgi:hypothetical protein
LAQRTPTTSQQEALTAKVQPHRATINIPYTLIKR